jgi:hypothetical protein
MRPKLPAAVRTVSLPVASAATRSQNVLIGNV